jgi:dTDP-4-dehydrorhamnose reductase
LEKNFPKTCVIGADGFIGSNLVDALKRLDPTVIGTSRREKSPYALNLAKPDIRSFSLAEKKIRYALITAGMANIGFCESHPVESHAVNVAGTLELVQQLSSQQIIPVFFSTDYVFDGESGGYGAESVPNPLNEYGHQKKEVEDWLRIKFRKDYLIVRLSKVYSVARNDGLIFSDIYSKLKIGQEVIAAYDLIFSPTYIGDVTEAVLRLISSGAKGVVHIAAPEAISRLNLTRKLAAAMQISSPKIRSVSLDDLSPSIKRPKNTSLVATQHLSLEGFMYLSIDDAITKFLLSGN